MMLFRVDRLTAGLALAGCANFAQAAGFALIEQNASGLGNAYAGQAAAATDASTVFFNPAGMGPLPGSQLVVAGNLIKPSAEFQNGGSTAAPLQTLGDAGGDAGDLGFVPNLYYVAPVNQNLSLGIGLNAPFGLKTEYDQTWMGRFQAVTSEVKTINLNPSLSYKLNDTVLLGIGLSAQYIDAKLTNMVNYSPLAKKEGLTLHTTVGIGYETLKALNPKLVYCSISAFGQSGPYAEKPGFDTLGQAMSGLLSCSATPTSPRSWAWRCRIMSPDFPQVTAF